MDKKLIVRRNNRKIIGCTVLAICLLIVTLSVSVIFAESRDNALNKVIKHTPSVSGIETNIVPNPNLTASCGIDIVLVFDGSESINFVEYSQMQTAFVNFVNAFLPKTPTQIAIVEFASSAILRQPFIDTATTLINEINESRVQPGGPYTNWEQGLVYAHNQFPNRDEKPDLIIFISDGNPNKYGNPPQPRWNKRDPETAVIEAIAVADAIKSDGIRIMTLGIGDNLNSTNLIKISSENAYYHTDFETLAQTLSDIANELCGGTVDVKVLVDGSPAPGWNFTAECIGGTINPSSGTTDENGFIVFDIEFDNGVSVAIVNITEVLQGGYHFIDAYAENCSGGPIGKLVEHSIINISVTENCVIYCEFTNSKIIFKYDFGDAPDPAYPTLLSSNGARHTTVYGFFLGTTVDNETNGQPDANATGDDNNEDIDDEDGVEFTTSIVRGKIATLNVTASCPNNILGLFSGWIDFNADGDWADPDEQIFNDTILYNGINELFFDIPCTVLVGKTYARFRYTTDTAVSYEGIASDGEVEDYKVEIEYEYPSQAIEVGYPKTIKRWRGDDYFVVRPSTPLWFNSTGCCEYIAYSTWVAVDLDDDPLQWIQVDDNISIFDGMNTDGDDAFGSISTKFLLNQNRFYQIRYQCWDYEGNTEGLLTFELFVESSQGTGKYTPNRKPIADANGPYQGFPNEDIEFNGSGSTDSDGRIVGYRWDFNNNGTYDTIWLPIPTITYNYSLFGTYTVKLQVKDNRGATDTNETTATIIRPNTPPYPPEINGPRFGTKNTTYYYTAVSRDNDNDSIQYIFDWDDDTTVTTDFLPNNTAASQSHSWTVPGIFMVKVNAYDNATESGTNSFVVLIDTWWVKHKGYLLDADSDGTYDIFYSNETSNETLVYRLENGTYLIDSDGDNKWNYFYDIKTDILMPYNEREEQNISIWYVLGIILIIGFISILAVVKAKRNRIKNK